MTFSLCGFLLFFFLINIRCAFFCSYEHLASPHFRLTFRLYSQQTALLGICHINHQPNTILCIRRYTAHTAEVCLPFSNPRPLDDSSSFTCYSWMSEERAIYIYNIYLRLLIIVKLRAALLLRWNMVYSTCLSPWLTHVY